MDKNNMSFGMKIIIVIFAIILVVSLMLPFFSSCGNNSAQDNSSTTESDDTSLSTVEGVDKVYQAKIDDLQVKLAADSTSLLNTANMGNTYMEWAEALQNVDTSTLTSTSTSTASGSAADALALINGSASQDADEGEVKASSSAEDATSAAVDAAADAVAELQQRVADTYAAAIPYFDQYLSQQDSKTVKVNRAMCEYYSGDEEAAIADLEEFVQEDGTFSPAWYSLGQLYEGAGRLSDASDAFSAAMSADQEDSYNLGVYASYQLSMISSYQDSLASAAADSSASVDASMAADASLDSDGETGGAE